VAAFAGAGVGGAVDGITGALIGMGIPEYKAKRHEGRVKGGFYSQSTLTIPSGQRRQGKSWSVLASRMFPRPVKPVPKKAIKPVFAKPPEALLKQLN